MSCDGAARYDITCLPCLPCQLKSCFRQSSTRQPLIWLWAPELFVPNITIYSHNKFSDVGVSAAGIKISLSPQEDGAHSTYLVFVCCLVTTVPWQCRYPACCLCLDNISGEREGAGVDTLTGPDRLEHGGLQVTTGGRGDPPYLIHPASWSPAFYFGVFTKCHKPTCQIPKFKLIRRSKITSIAAGGWITPCRANDSDSHDYINKS